MPNLRQFNATEINFLLEKGLDPFSKDLACQLEIPVEYIAKSANFLNKEFYVDENVLIPRIESEQIIELAEEFINSSNKQELVIADVGTGSGILGISLIYKLIEKNKRFKIYFIDKSFEALEIAKKNFNQHFPNGAGENEVVFLNSNLLEEFTTYREILDLIIANLPYIPSDRIDLLQASVKDFEPIIALDGGENGFSLINQLLSQAAPVLDKDGLIILEVDDTHDKEFIQKNHLNSNFNIDIKLDLNDKIRFWKAVKI